MHWHLENRISLNYAALPNTDIFHYMVPDISPLISSESLSSIGKQSSSYKSSESCFGRGRISKTLILVWKLDSYHWQKKLSVVSWSDSLHCLLRKYLLNAHLGNRNLCQSFFQVKMIFCENKALVQLATQIIVQVLFCETALILWCVAGCVMHTFHVITKY